MLSILKCLRDQCFYDRGVGTGVGKSGAAANRGFLLVLNLLTAIGLAALLLISAGGLAHHGADARSSLPAQSQVVVVDQPNGEVAQLTLNTENSTLESEGGTPVLNGSDLALCVLGVLCVLIGVMVALWWLRRRDAYCLRHRVHRQCTSTFAFTRGAPVHISLHELSISRT